MSTLVEVRDYLKGWKTYIAIIAYTSNQAMQYLNGEITLEKLIEVVLLSFVGLFLRAGMKK
jgi:hypothetical protein